MDDLAITEKAKYTECYVAFLDILGFKNLINESCCEEIYNFFQNILNYEPHPLSSKTTVYDNIKYTIMSDSIIVYIDATITDGFIALTDVCSQIQMRLLHRNTPIFLRGGIAKGNLYHKENILFGTGLTRAYMLENNVAVYPRIVFTEELRKKGLENTDRLYIFDYNPMYYEKDDDELYYIDYLHTFNFLKAIAPKNREEVEQINNEYFYRLVKHINEVLDKETDLLIRKKYLWLKNKVEKRIECMPGVKNFFEKLSAQEKEEADKRFNNALR